MTLRLRHWREWLIATGPVAVIYAAHLCLGANRAGAALSLSAACALTLLVFLLRESSREALARVGILPVLALLFAITLAVAAWTMTPWVPGGPHPLWTYAPEALPASSIDRGGVLVEIVKLAGLACIFLVGLCVGVERELARRACLALVWFGSVFALLGLIGLSHAAATGDARLYAGFGSANNAGAVLAMLSLFSAPLLLRSGSSADVSRRDHRTKAEAAISHYAPPLGLLLLFLGCLVLTASRGAMIAAAAGGASLLLLLLFAGRIRLRQAGAGLLVSAVAAGALLAIKGGLAIGRFGHLAADAHIRTAAVAAHWQAFLRSPLFGYGLGSFDETNKMVLTQQLYPALWAIRALHNVYLQWLEEAGVIGAVPMFLCLGLIMVSTLKGLSARRRSASWICALLAADVVILVHGLADYALQVPSIAAFWALLLGLQLGLSRSSAGSRL